MNFKYLEPTQKKTIIITVSLFLIIIIIIFAGYIINSRNTYGEEVKINNYDKYINILPNDRKNAINNSLYNIIKNNLNSDNINIQDAIIRDGSVTTDYNKSTSIYAGSFIVDIPSIKQSYSVTYEWSSIENNINLSGYSATVSCLSSDKLIYSDFNCKDDFINTDKTSNEILLDSLPYSTFNYTITANIEKDNKIKLNIDMILYSSDTQNNERDNSVNKYKTEIINWIKSKNLNPDDFIINYIINTHE